MSHYGDVLARGHEVCKLRLMDKLYQMALAGDRACLSYLTKVFCDWSDTGPQRIDLVSSDGSMSPSQARLPSLEEVERWMGACDRIEWDDGRTPRGPDKKEAGVLLS